MTLEGHALPPGLGWEAFFAHAGVQARLRKTLGLPPGVVLRPAYPSAASFEDGVVRPLVLHIARSELAAYEAPVAAFEAGGAYFQQGEEAARAVIVPPVALLFSLLGAIGHLAKFVYLLLRLSAAAVPAWRGLRHLWCVPVALLTLSGAALSAADNAVTRSDLYGYMRGQMLPEPDAPWRDRASARVLLVGLHWVAVGQGMGYPVNEWVRTRALRNFSFGYEPPPT
jgi:hypothetical protein